MRLMIRDGIYIAESTFREKDIPKGAGMRWNAGAKRWETRDWHVALRLAEYCDDEAKAAIEQAQQAEAASIEASRATDADIEVPAPEGLAYMPFQRAGIAYAAGREHTLIADEMGLGKTIEALGVINADESIRTVLVICPASLRLNWRREARRWLVRENHITISNTHDLPRSAEALTAGLPADHVVMLIVNYDILCQWHTPLRSITWDLMISDESHYLKNPKAQRTVQVFGQSAWTNPRTGETREEILPIPARRRLYLTGTPIVNRPIELWPLLHSLGWRSWRDYVTRYCDGHQNGYGWRVDGASNLDELQEKLRSTIMVRRLKRDVLTELPAKRRQVIELPANGAAEVVRAEAEAWGVQREHLEDLQERVELAKASEDPEEYRAAVDALREGTQAAFNEMSRLRHETALAKVPYIVEHVRTVLESGVEKIVVWGHHTDVIRAIAGGIGGPDWQTHRQMDRDRKDIAIDGGGAQMEVPMPMRNGEGGGPAIPAAGHPGTGFGDLNRMPGLQTGEARDAEGRARGPEEARSPVRDVAQRASASEAAEAGLRPDSGRHQDSEDLSIAGDSDLPDASSLRSAQSLSGQDHPGERIRSGQHLGDQLESKRHQARCQLGRVRHAGKQPAEEDRIYGVVICTGKESFPERQAAVDSFQRDPGIRVFIGSIQAAGVGITLTAAAHVVFAELDWVPGNMSQAEDRCHRIGQTGSGRVQHLVLEASLDAEIANRLVEKQEVLDAALDDQAEPADRAWGSMISIGEPATRNHSRAQIEQEAESLCAEEIERIHQGLRILAGMCDGAVARDNVGFDRMDTRIGHSLAAAEHLTARQAALGRRLLHKYHRQLPTEVGSDGQR